MGKSNGSKKDRKIAELKAQNQLLRDQLLHVTQSLGRVDDALRNAQFQGSSEVEWLRSFQDFVLYLAQLRGVGPAQFLYPVAVPASTHDPRTGEPLVPLPKQALIDRLVAEDEAAGTHSLVTADEVSDAT
jgi:hypothetical protein